MKQRRNLFLIGLLSAVVTVVSLNIAFGSRYQHYPFYKDYNGCYYRNNDRLHNNDHSNKNQQKADSLKNY